MQSTVEACISDNIIAFQHLNPIVIISVSTSLTLDSLGCNYRCTWAHDVETACGRFALHPHSFHVAGQQQVGFRVDAGGPCIATLLKTNMKP